MIYRSTFRSATRTKEFGPFVTHVDAWESLLSPLLDWCEDRELVADGLPEVYNIVDSIVAGTLSPVDVGLDELGGTGRIDAEDPEHPETRLMLLVTGEIEL